MTLGARPETFRIVSPRETSLTATVDAVEELGADAYVYCSLDEEPYRRHDLVVRCNGDEVPQKGRPVAISLDASKTFLFSVTSGERLRR